MHREYHKWFSSYLKRDMELLIFGHRGKAVLFFPTRMARFYDYENWHIIDSLKDRINAGELQIFCVDSVDAESFYNQQVTPEQRIIRHIAYEKYITREVLHFMQKENRGNDYLVAGCSMGAYHAMNIALKYPGLFNKVVAMSGRYDLTKALHDFKDLFDGYHDENIYDNMPLQYMANLDSKKMIKAINKIEIVLVIGKTDPFFAGNQEFSQLLYSRKIFHKFFIWDGDAHRPRYWRQMVQLYL